MAKKQDLIPIEDWLNLTWVGAEMFWYMEENNPKLLKQMAKDKTLYPYLLEREEFLYDLGVKNITNLGVAGAKELVRAMYTEELTPLKDLIGND